MKHQIFLVCLFISHFSFAQLADNTDRNNETNIYYQALSYYLKSFDTEAKVLDTLYIEDDYKITDSLLLKSNKATLVKLTYEQLINLLKKRESIVLYTIFPFDFSQGEFSVSFVPFIVSKKKRNINYSNPGSYRVVFKFFDSKFHFLRVEGMGI